jgi:excisionase family DNA binding protein
MIANTWLTVAAILPALLFLVMLAGVVSGSDDTTQRGLTPNELARVLRVSADRVRAWIKSGELGALDTARHRCGRPRYVILPRHLAEFEQRRRAATAPPKPPRRRRRQTTRDYYPD